MWHKRWVKWRGKMMVGGVVTLIIAATYPVIISPMLHPEKWQDVQKRSRAAINQADIQPGGMKVWSDPFEKKK